MKINNNDFGGFIISKNVLKKTPIRYSFREKSEVAELNGWNFYSVEDDEYVNNPDNFLIVTAETIFQISQIAFEIFEAPYGTDLYWFYEEDVHVGFYDLKEDRETTIEQILK